VAFTVTLAACAPVTKQIKVDTAAQNAEEKLQREAALQVRMRDIERLYRVSDPIVEKAASYCEDKVKYGLGVHVFTLDAFGEAMREAEGGTRVDAGQEVAISITRICAPI